MNRSKAYPYLVTFIIMAVFFGITTGILPTMKLNDPLDLGRVSLVITAIQVVLSIIIVTLMRRDGTYPLLEEPGVFFGRLFKPVLAWLFIIIKFVAILLMLTYLPDEAVRLQPLPLLIATALALSIGLFEELLFRGFLFKNLLADHNESKVMRAAIISSVLFGLFHIDFIMVSKGQMIGAQLGIAWFATGIGLYFAGLVYRFQKLWIPIILHALIDVSTFYLIAVIDGDSLFDILEPVISITDMGGTGSNPLLIAIGVGFFLAGYRMLHKTISARREERLAYERSLEYQNPFDNSYFPDPADFQPRDTYLNDQDSKD